MRHLLLSSLTLSMCAAVSAAVLHDWQFNDPAGTTMSAAVNQGVVGVAWDGNLANSITTGTGVMRIRRNSTLTSRRADMGVTVVAPQIHMVAEIAGWSMPVLSAGVVNELRWELLNGTTLNASTQVTAAFRLFFLENGQVTLETGAGGTGSTRREAEPVFTNIQNEPVTLALSYNQVQQTYVVQYKIGSGSWTEFFRGDVAPDRSAVSFRFAVRGDFDGGGQNYFDFDRFVISTEFPPPAQDDPPPPVFGNLHAWHFGEEAGTALADTLNWVNPDVRWDGNLSNSATRGNGVFRLQRGDTLINRRVDVGNLRNSTEAHMRIDLAGWDLRHVQDPESQPEIRFEFIDAPASEDSTSITAGLRLNRLATGEVTLQAVAGGLASPGGVESEELPVFSSLQSEPLALMVSYSKTNNEYAVHYRSGAGSWIEFFRGTTSGVRSAQSWRMAVRGDFDGLGQNHLDIDRFVVANVLPDETGPWDLAGPTVPGYPVATAFGPVDNAFFPWVYLQATAEWLYVFPGTSYLDHGVYAYRPATGAWLWSRADAAPWWYAVDGVGQWLKLDQ
jgi:hypothetical protein